MKKGYLSEYFTGVVVKRLSAVEANPAKSNQHEFNGSGELRSLLGHDDKKNIPTRFLWIGQEQESADAVDGFVSWYDARRNHPKRSEYRLYYQGNDTTSMMREGDSFFLAFRQDGSGLVVITPTDSTMYNQLLWLFGIEKTTQLDFEFQAVTGNNDAELDFAARSILEALGIEPEEGHGDEIARLAAPFGSTMPKASELSALARQSIGLDIAHDDPDAALLAWIEREIAIFKQIERQVVAERLGMGFDGGGTADVEGFLAFSLSVQNRRKSRAGLALESHMEAILTVHGLRFTHGAVTENGNRPDFLFPGAEAYRDPAFPAASLTMLGAKTTLKERWRQVLSEAERIERKHLLTLEAGISEQQTSEMQIKNLQLVVPSALFRTYKPDQQAWLMDFRSFIAEVKLKQ